MRLWVALFAAAPLWGLCPGELSIEAGDRWAHLAFRTDAPGPKTATRLRFYSPGRGHAPWAFVESTQQAGSPDETARSRTIYQLEPETAYIVEPQVSDPGGRLWSALRTCQARLCPDGAGVQRSLRSRYACAPTDEPGIYAPTFTTAASPATVPDPPRPPRIAEPIDGAALADGSVLRVAPGCVDLQRKLDECRDRADADGRLHRVLVPAGSICSPALEGLSGYTLPRLSEGRCWLLSDADPALLPPEGGAIDPGYRTAGGVATIEGHPHPANWNGYMGGVVSSPAMGTSRWTLGPGLEFRPPPVERAAQRRVAIAAIEPNGTIRSPRHGLPNGALVEVYAPGVAVSALHRGGCRVFRVDGDSFRCVGARAIQGVYMGGGYWTDALAWSLEGCSADGLCRTATPHPYGDHHAWPVVSVDGDRVRLVANSDIDAGSSVKLEGFDGRCRAGLYGVRSRKGAELVLMERAGVCSGGTVRQVRGVLLRGPWGQGGYLATFPSETTVRIEQPAPPPAFEGGWVSVDPGFAAQGILSLSRSVGVRLDRVLVSAPHPLRLAHAVSVGGAGRLRASGLYLDGPRPWFVVDPNTGSAHRTSGLRGFATMGVGFAATGLQDAHIRRVRQTDSAFLIFADTSRTGGPSDWLVEAVQTWYRPERVQNHRNNVAVASRHAFEIKMGERIALDGFDFRNCIAQLVPQGECLQIAQKPHPSATRNELTDIAIRNGVLTGAAGASLVANTALHYRRMSAVQRIAFDNLLILTDRKGAVAAPGGQGLEMARGYAGNFGGSPLRLDLGVHVDLSRLTLRGGGNRPAALWAPKRGASAVRLRSSILFASTPKPSSAAGGLFTLDSPGGQTQIPAVPNGSDWQIFRETFRSGPERSDPASSFDARLVPCSDSADAPSWLDDRNGAFGAVRNGLACSAREDGCATRFRYEAIGKNGQSCRERADLAFEPGSWRPKKDVWPGYGADVDEIRAALRHVAPKPTGIPGGVRLTYIAPDEEACHGQTTVATRRVGDVDIPDWSKATAWKADAGGARLRTLDLLGHAAGQIVWYRLSCGLAQPVGRTMAR